ncbi:MAG: hypothetical protein A4E45_00044 [Methanosaeta sp. PtaB.Bin039]|nr:MAG: hypothetical protein A4E45_00044 [Methanosaeta sp. PtaB.Bin039]
MRKILTLLVVGLVVLSCIASATYTAISAVSSLDDQNDYAKAPGAWTTLAGNGSINYYDWPEGYDLVVGLNYTSTTNSTLDYFSLMAGDGAQAFRSGIGNLSYSSLGAGVYWFGPVESARFMNASGYLEISSGYITGKVTVLKVK